MYTIKQGDQPSIPKEAADSLRYGIDVTAVLASLDSVSTASAAAVGTTGLTVGAASITGAVITSRISGGTPGERTEIVFTWTTSQGDTDTASIWIEVDS